MSEQLSPKQFNISNPPPSIDLFSPSTGITNVHEPLSFNIQVSDPSNLALSYSLAFGDGTSSELFSCLSASASCSKAVTHTYTQAGTFEAKLVAQNEFGSAQRNVSIQG